MSPTLSYKRILLWVVALAAVGVGLRNFEEGLSIDGPAYATVARNIAQTGEWFRLSASVPDYQPYFADHPHLALWLEAIVFKVLPAEDWAARIPGHLFYVGFLFLYFYFVRKKSTQTIAIGSTLVLWSFYQFSNTFSSFYLDPATLFFGTLAVFYLDKAMQTRRALDGGISGAALALSAMSKGMAALAFVPSMVLLLGEGVPLKRRKDFWFVTIAAVSGSAAVLFVYFLAVRFSNAPDYFQIYWDHQFTHRVGKTWSVANALKAPYWEALNRYSYWLILPALVSLRHLRKNPAVRLASVLAFTGIALYAPSNFNGGQYLVYVLPWVAWLAVIELSEWVSIKRAIDDKIVRYSTLLCVGVIFAVNYFPVRVHKHPVSPDLKTVRAYRNVGAASRVVISTPQIWDRFTVGCHIAWYGNVEVEYWDGKIADVPVAPQVLLLHTASTEAEKSLLKQRGWCPVHTTTPGGLWESCLISSSRSSK